MTVSPSAPDARSTSNDAPDRTDHVSTWWQRDELARLANLRVDRAVLAAQREILSLFGLPAERYSDVLTGMSRLRAGEFAK